MELLDREHKLNASVTYSGTDGAVELNVRGEKLPARAKLESAMDLIFLELMTSYLLFPLSLP